MKLRSIFLTITLAAYAVTAGALAQTASPTPFATPEEAGQALLKAAESGDVAAVIRILGPSSKPLVESGDPVHDKMAHDVFVRAARTSLKTETDPINPDLVFLLVGEDEFPLPIPLHKSGDKWTFDADYGKLELLARRIGTNELNAIDICLGYVDAQLEYAEVDRTGRGMHEYARKLISTPGKKDGLYWESKPGEPESPVAEAMARAAAAGYSISDKPAPFHGYYFRVLTAQGPAADEGARNYIVSDYMIGGFALVGWPAEYGTSGIKTFIVNQSGVVYEKDLGPNTAALAKQITVYNPDKSWTAVR